MQLTNLAGSMSSGNILVENTVIRSEFLDREVEVDFFLPRNLSDLSEMNLLLINDGQNMKELGLKKILEELYGNDEIEPLLCVAIHANEHRKMEYGTAIQTDYLGRGAKAGLFTSFIMQELLLFIAQRFRQVDFKEKAFAGFSLGGLMALDIAWNHPREFKKTGIFSGSLWWRKVDDRNKQYSDELHRIMHQQVKQGKYHPGLKFFFTTGSLDEVNDRNNNGVIDSIDDTMSLVADLEKLGYKIGEDIIYVNFEDGRHDIATWARAMPQFLKWGWGIQ
jgi:enterochelin esterase-like enzyme